MLGLAVARPLRRRAVDRGEPGRGVGLVAGQVEEREGDAVARPPGVRARAHVGRHHHLQRLRRLPAALREAPQPARAGGEHDVVGAHAEAPADRAQVAERARDADVVAARRAGAVQRRARRGREQGVRERAGAAAREPGQPPRSARQAHRRERERRAVGGAVDDRAREPLAGRGRRRRRPPAAAATARHRHLGVEQRVAELDHGGAVDHAVVRLADDRDAPAGQRVHDPHLPQRAVAPQRRREDGVDERAQVLALGRQQMVGGVVGGIVDPHRLVQPERHARQPLAIAREALERARRCARRARRSWGSARPPADRSGDPADVHRRGGGLDGEEGGVEGGQSLGGHGRAATWASLRPAAASGRR